MRKIRQRYALLENGNVVDRTYVLRNKEYQDFVRRGHDFYYISIDAKDLKVIKFLGKKPQKERNLSELPMWKRAQNTYWEEVYEMFKKGLI